MERKERVGGERKEKKLIEFLELMTLKGRVPVSTDQPWTSAPAGPHRWALQTSLSYGEVCVSRGKLTFKTPHTTKAASASGHGLSAVGLGDR